MGWKDPDVRRQKHAEYMRVYLAYPQNKAKHLRRVAENKKKYTQRNSAIIGEFKKDGCSYCEETDPAALVAHHRDPLTKDMEIGLLRPMASVERLLAELAKCDCVCANCHLKLHAGR